MKIADLQAMCQQSRLINLVLINRKSKIGKRVRLFGNHGPIGLVIRVTPDGVAAMFSSARVLEAIN